MFRVLGLHKQPTALGVLGHTGKEIYKHVAPLHEPLLAKTWKEIYVGPEDNDITGSHRLHLKHSSVNRRLATTNTISKSTQTGVRVQLSFYLTIAFPYYALSPPCSPVYIEQNNTKENLSRICRNCVDSIIQSYMSPFHGGIKFVFTS